MARGASTAMTYQVTGTGERDVQDLLVAAQRAGSLGVSLGLDLSRLDDGYASSRRIGPWWVSSLSNLLMGRFCDVPLSVALPAASGVRLQLLRGGLYYALAQRTGPVDYTTSDEASEEVLNSSKGTWAPRKGPVLFQEASGTPVGGRSYLYSNTHLRAESGYFRRYEGSAAFPFLGDVIPRPREGAGAKLRETFLLATCETLVEVLDNISTHAFNRLDTDFDASWLGPMIVDRARSCLLVGLTTGGANSYDRLHFVACDNGFGIPRTMRWKHAAPLQLSDSASIMECVLRERLTDREIEGHAGAGLWCLCGLARFAGGTITITSEDDRSDGQRATLVQISVPPKRAEDPSLEITSRSMPLPWRGTTVHVQIRIPRLEGADGRQLTELTSGLQNYRATRLQPV